MTYLERLAELERMYDGPIPPALLDAAIFGSASAAIRAHSLAEAGYFTTLATGQVRAIRLRREDGSYDPSMRLTLALYLRERRKFLKLAAFDQIGEGVA